jgi:hypothetical protein
MAGAKAPAIFVWRKAKIGGGPAVFSAEPP